MALDVRTTSRPAIAPRVRPDAQSLSAQARRRGVARAALPPGHGSTRAIAPGLGRRSPPRHRRQAGTPATPRCSCRTSPPHAQRGTHHGGMAAGAPQAAALLRLGAGGGRHPGHTPLGTDARHGVLHDRAVPLRVAPCPGTSACQGVRGEALPPVPGLRHKPKTPQGLPVTVRGSGRT